MKNTLLQTLRLCVMVLLLSATSTIARASHAAAMELTYTSSGNNYYTFTLHFYRDNCGISPSNSITINFSSSCGTQQLTLTADAPVSINSLCSAFNNQTCCTGGTLSCFSQYTYTGSCYLPLCSDWVVSYSECCRNAAIVNLTSPGTANLYSETRLNNISFPNNNSVQFNRVPVVFACASAPFSYYPTAFDLDGDSLVFSSPQPLTAANTTIAWVSGYSTNNPLGSGSFTIDSTTGVIHAPPTPAGNYVISMQIEEYRNGVLVATTIRDIQVLILSTCGVQTPEPYFPTVNDESINGSIIDTTAQDDQFSVCAGSTLSFSFMGSASSNMSYSTNLNNSFMPGAILIITGDSTPTINGQFTWNTTGVSAGSYSFYVVFQDNNCPSNHVVSRVFTIRVKTLDLSASMPYICVGNTNTVQLGANISNSLPLTGTFSWSPSIGLDNPNIINPIATISQATTYTLNYTGGVCQLTNQITLSPSPYTVTLSDINDEILCATNSVVLNANAINADSVLSFANQTSTVIPRAIGGVPTTIDIPFNVHSIAPTMILSLNDLDIINSINFSIDQQLVDHLIISLVAPSGQSVLLSQNNGGGGNGYVNSTFAYPVPGTALPITNYNNIPIPTNGSFFPQGGAAAWQSLIGATVNGTWLLRIVHNGTGTTYDGNFLGATLKFNTSNSVSYTWTPSNSLDNANIASPTASPTTTTSYQLVASNSAGCSDTTQVTVYVQNTLPAPVFEVQATVQYPIVFRWHHVAGAASYELSLDGGNTFFNNGSSRTYIPSGLTVGDTVTLCVRGLPAAGSGCIASPLTCQSYVLGPCTSFVTTIDGRLSVCPNNTTNLTAINLTGAAPYSYLWSTGDTTSHVTGIAAGTYTISVTDGNSCMTIDTVVVGTYPAISADIAPSNLHCYEDNSGMVIATPIGGTAPYTYHWSNGYFSAVVDNLPVGAYSVTISDRNYCTASDQVNLTQPSPLFAEASVTDVTCSQALSGAVVVNNVLGGIPPYQYYWSNGVTGATNNNLNIGAYTVTVSDASFCYYTITKYVEQATQLAITGSTTNNESPFNIGTATVSVANGTPPYTYYWDNGMQGSTITNLFGGPYTVIVSDANNCTATLSLIVNDINGTSPAINATPNLDVLPNPNNGVFDIKLEHADNESVQLDILNINGQLIYHTELNTPHIQLPIDLSQQPSGHYIVKATLGQQVYLKRFIIR